MVPLRSDSEKGDTDLSCTSSQGRGLPPKFAVYPETSVLFSALPDRPKNPRMATKPKKPKPFDPDRASAMLRDGHAIDAAAKRAVRKAVESHTPPQTPPHTPRRCPSCGADTRAHSPAAHSSAARPVQSATPANRSPHMAQPPKKVKKQVKSKPKPAGPGTADNSRASEALPNRGPRDYAADKALNRGINAPAARAPRRAH